MKLKKIWNTIPIAMIGTLPIASLSLVTNQNISPMIGSQFKSESFQNIKANKGYRYLRGFETRKYTAQDAFNDNWILDGTNDLGNDFNGEVGSTHDYTKSKLSNLKAKNTTIEFIGYVKERYSNGTVDNSKEYTIFSIYNHDLSKYFTIILFGNNGKLNNTVFNFASPQLGFIDENERTNFYDSIRLTFYDDLYYYGQVETTQKINASTTSVLMSSGTGKNVTQNILLKSSFSFKSSWGVTNSVTRNFKHEYTMSGTILDELISNSTWNNYVYAGNLSFSISDLYMLPSQKVSEPHDTSNVQIKKITLLSAYGTTITEHKIYDTNLKKTKPADYNYSTLGENNFLTNVENNGLYFEMNEWHNLRQRNSDIKIILEGSHYVSAKSGSLVGSTTTATLNDIYLACDLNISFLQETKILVPGWTHHKNVTDLNVVK